MATSASQDGGAAKDPATAAPPAGIGYPNAHLGFLTSDEEKALVEFKELLVTEALYTPPMDGKAPSHSDALLLRFLRARRFVPKDAVQQFRDTEQWRKLNDIDDLYLNINVDDFDECRRYYTHWIGRRDKRGFPVCLLCIGALDSDAMLKYTKSTAELRVANGSASKTTERAGKTPPRLLRLFTIYEYFVDFLTSMCTALSDRPTPEVPITQSTNIVDISGVGLRQFWSLRTHMQEATNLATANYPEILDRIFIVGAPYFFPTVWSWVKRLFDPVTASKIFILSDAEVLPTLSEFMLPEDIPKRYGGTLEFEFGDLPAVDPSYADRLVWRDDGASGVKNAKGEFRRWPKGPVKWVVREDGDWDLLAVGSVYGVQRREVVATMKVADDLGGSADASMQHLRKNVLGAEAHGTATAGVPTGKAQDDAE